ncbi:MULTISPECIES: carbonic anhydrase [Rhizobium]|jgi:carbonic anhydrase|uniref:Carbonic anhydrase n=2 Tax=Rhizobium TaxID=379 RepID=A0A6P1C6G4_RHITR|nr:MULTISPECIES: carbonic anhydrase [Rhizobium]AGB73081.1 carbonate dehydratase [Rhizobium tropici CIAT 899]MBB4244206.1 carbonic anhydrase [Rhizobium tropici]MBB5595309.1 carbonic anhydrase [Rhizobium tropici]MBB6494621.1 carbonic anhydrase [Rhizobium tropici]MDR6901545.1 carbonic anhydrase [Rhizobium miluonense]
MSSFPDTLLNGYRNFMSGRYVDERERYRTLAELGQNPSTLVIACSDSRSAPEIIFDAGPGELFVIRNVANMVPPYEPDSNFHATSAALEFAVLSLKVSDIVVMGHGRCGGIRAALDPNAEPLSPGDFIGRWMGLLKPAAEQIQSNDIMTQTERQTALERISIRNSLDNLRSFPEIRAREEEGKLNLHGAWFDISTGELWVMDPATRDFIRPEI